MVVIFFNKFLIFNDYTLTCPLKNPKFKQKKLK